MRWIVLLACGLLAGCEKPHTAPKATLQDDIPALTKEIGLSIHQGLGVRGGALLLTDRRGLLTYAAFPSTRSWWVECSVLGITLHIEGVEYELIEGTLSNERDSCPKLLLVSVAAVRRQISASL